MLMVIFGAGASYDSAPQYVGNYPLLPYGPSQHAIARSRLPLANELFDDRPEFAEVLTRFPECQPVMPQLRHRKNDAPVEQVLEELQREAENYPEGIRQLTAIRYYLHVMIWQCELQWEKIHNGVTNYKYLLDRIHRQLSRFQRVCLVTFNYDRMLEAALPVVGIHIESIDDYVNSNEYKIIKLHGSVNWGRIIDGRPVKDLNRLRPDQIPGEVIHLAPQLLTGKSVSRNFVIVGNCPMGKANDVAIYPAIAIPMERKLDFECPAHHLDMVKKCIPETKKLLVIGWRAKDEPFLKMLGNELPDQVSVMVVAGSAKDANEIVERLQLAGIRGEPFLTVNSGFTSIGIVKEFDDFLKS